MLKLLGQGIFVHQYSFTHATPKANLFLEKWNLSSIFLVPPQISEGKQKAVQAWKPTAEEERVIIPNQVKVATPSTKIIFEPEMLSEPQQYRVELTSVMYINKNH